MSDLTVVVNGQNSWAPTLVSPTLVPNEEAIIVAGSKGLSTVPFRPHSKHRPLVNCGFVRRSEVDAARGGLVGTSTVSRRPGIR